MNIDKDNFLLPLELAELLGDRLKNKISLSAYPPGTEPSIAQTQRWLLWLAAKSPDNTTEFIIEKMQPDWLETRPQRWLYHLGVGLIAGLAIGAIYGVSTGLIGASIGGLTYGLILGCNQKIYPIESLKFSLEFAKVALLGAVFEGLWWGLIYGLIDALIDWLNWGIDGLIWGTIEVLIWGLIEGLIWGLTVPVFSSKTVNNQGIKESAKNAVIFTAIGGIAWLLLYAGVQLAVGEVDEPLSLLTDGLSNGLFFGIYIGGFACLQHFVLRLILWWNGYIPWNYAKFLNYAVELGFLKREGDRYLLIISH